LKTPPAVGALPKSTWLTLDLTDEEVAALPVWLPRAAVVLSSQPADNFGEF
jgi:hypothetical protein